MQIKKLPPQTVVFMGKCGVGKTSTVNRLFDLDWYVSHFEAATKAAQYGMYHSMGYPHLHFEFLEFIDLMGVGESVETNEAYYQVYRRWMSRATTVFWITAADRRVYKQDELCLERLLDCFGNIQKFYIGLNKSDSLIAAHGIDPKEISNPRETPFFTEKIHEVQSYFNSFLSQTHIKILPEDVIPYSTRSGWQFESIQQLFFEGVSHA